VRAGIYYEHIFINKTLTLVGENSNFTIIDGNETDNVIHIMADHVTVENFAIRKSRLYYPYSGIFIDHSTDNIIINNNVTYNYEGISLLSSSGNVICNNTISNNIARYNTEAIVVDKAQANWFFLMTYTERECFLESSSSPLSPMQKF
jgi:parallel beta-helix repeat protein